jgi:hypothetical protein
VKCIHGASATGSRLVLRVVYGCVGGARSLCGLIFPQEAGGGHLMSYVLAEINFAAFEQPRGAVVGLDGIGAGLLAFLEAAGDTLSRLVGFPLASWECVFSCCWGVLFSCWLPAFWATAGKLTRAVKASKLKNLLACFIFAISSADVFESVVSKSCVGPLTKTAQALRISGKQE